MDRYELVRRLVLNSIFDDYENVDQVILRGVAEDGAKCGLTIERSEIVNALSGLIMDGLAKARLLSGTKPHVTELQGMPQIDVPERYFKPTCTSRRREDLQLFDDTW
jgi:hypothetical protein